MKLEREGDLYGKQSFSASWQKAKSRSLSAVIAALSSSALVTTSAAQAQPVQATRVFAAPAAAATPRSIAMQQHVDQMAILVEERNYMLEKLKKWEVNGDKAVVARIQADLQALDREIARSSRQPVYPTSSVAIAKAAGAKTESAASAANQESQTKESETGTYEGWDIFKNFGRKGNHP